jgi:acetyltransferase-like isoleucine patch superfamily enzyme
MIHLDKSKIDKLTGYGINFDGMVKNIPSDFVGEIPCSLKRTEIGPRVEVGAFSYMVSGYLFATKMGRYCSIGENVQIGRQNHPLDWVSTSPYFYLPSNEIQPAVDSIADFTRDSYYEHGVPATTMKHTTIGHNVWIGHGAIVNAGVSIGNGAIIASGSVVTKDVQPYAIVGGNPAKFIRFRIKEEDIEELEKTQWWEYTPKQLEQFTMHDIKKFINDFNLANLEKYNCEKILLGNFTF